MLHDDKQAMEWFDLARRSAVPQIATEANTAYKNLRPSMALFRTTAWITPFYSSRWKDVFAYSQVKTDLNLGRLGFRPYLSTRIIGDTGTQPAAILHSHSPSTCRRVLSFSHSVLRPPAIRG